jgi:DNA-directed RNA polymerase III subunit RPC1
VRNSENTVVQFVYGDDGLNPDRMENNSRPIDFDRVFLHVSQVAPCHDELTLTANELMERVEEKLAEERFKRIGVVLMDDIRSFFSGLVKKQKDLDDSGCDDISDLGRRFWNSCRVTPSQLDLMLDLTREKCLKAYVEPGEAVGAIGAQSISEPGTQMTLKVRSW